jgi:hypothetical protein
MFEPARSNRTVEDDPGAPFFNDTTKYVVSGERAGYPPRLMRRGGHRGRRCRLEGKPAQSELIRSG